MSFVQKASVVYFINLCSYFVSCWVAWITKLNIWLYQVNLSIFCLWFIFLPSVCILKCGWLETGLYIKRPFPSTFVDDKYITEKIVPGNNKNWLLGLHYDFIIVWWLSFNFSLVKTFAVLYVLLPHNRTLPINLISENYMYVCVADCSWMCCYLWWNWHCMTLAKISRN